MFHNKSALESTAWIQATLKHFTRLENVKRISSQKWGWADDSYTKSRGNALLGPSWSPIDNRWDNVNIDKKLWPISEAFGLPQKDNKDDLLKEAPDESKFKFSEHCDPKKHCWQDDQMNRSDVKVCCMQHRIWFCYRAPITGCTGQTTVTETLQGMIESSEELARSWSIIKDHWSWYIAAWKAYMLDAHKTEYCLELEWKFFVLSECHFV